MAVPLSRCLDAQIHILEGFLSSGLTEKTDFYVRIPGDTLSGSAPTM